MKKGILVLLFITSNIFTQEVRENNVAQAAEVSPINKNIFNRFGMMILPLSFGFGYQASMFPLSLFIANENNVLISFGLEMSANSGCFWDPEVKKQYGGFIGVGKLYPSTRNSKIHMGFLMQLSAGYAPESIIGYPFYIGLHPKFVLETKSFLFTLGGYIDTSLIITSTVGIGFLI